MNKPSNTVAILSFDGDVYLYAETLRYVAWKLKNNVFKTIGIRCSGALNSCTSLNSQPVTSVNTKTDVCSRCIRAQKKIEVREIFQIEKSNFSVEGFEYVELVKRTLLACRKVDSVLDLQYQNYYLCRIAFFDFSIKSKKSQNSELNDELINDYILSINDLLKLLEEFERFYHANQIKTLVYVNGNYSHNTLARQFFSKKSVKCFSVEPQPTSQHILNKIVLMPERMKLAPEGLHSVEKGKKTAVIKDVRSVLTSFGTRIDGGEFNAYTSLQITGVSSNEAHTLLEFFGTYKRIHSYFLSSEDELTPHVVTHGAIGSSGPNNLGCYRSQLEFTRYIISEAKKYPDIGFIIRLHPRMAINKRDRFESEEHGRYKNLLNEIDIHENVKVLYGDSKISSYFLVVNSDLVIVSWSTIAIEAGFLGVPIISAFPECLMFPLSMFSNQPKNEKEMHAALFCVSCFGSINDMALLSWASEAYEGQFVPTAAPRGRGGWWGRIYRKIYKIMSGLSLYWFIANFVDRLYPIKLTFIEENAYELYFEYNQSNENANSTAGIMLDAYREDYRQQLSIYGDRLREMERN